MQHFLALFRAWAASNKAPVEECITLAVETCAALAKIPAPVADLALPVLEGVIMGTHNNPAVPAPDGSGTFAAGPVMNATHAVAVAVDAAAKITALVGNLNPTQAAVAAEAGKVADLFIPNSPAPGGDLNNPPTNG